MNILTQKDKLILLACVIYALIIFRVMDSQEFWFGLFLTLTLLAPIGMGMHILFGDRDKRKKRR